MPQIHEKRYTAAEFWALLPELPADKRYELIDGALLIMPPSSNKPPAGYVFGADDGYTLDDGTAAL